MNYRSARIKNTLEYIFMYPFVILGKLIGHWLKPKRQTRFFLFFSNADIGGSVKVNADIAHAIKDEKPIIIFSKKPRNNKFRELFEDPDIYIIDLHKYIDKKQFHFLNFIYRGIIATWINSVENPVVFGGECIFFYKIVPHVKESTKTIEQCHLNTWFDFSQAFIKYIDYRLFSTKQIMREVEAQYRKNNVPDTYFNKLHFHDNMIDIPPLKKTKNEQLEVLFVGRGSPQKRVHLLAAIADRILNSRSDINFTFVGDVEDIVPVEVQEKSTMHGNVNNAEKLSAIYDESDVLILTSAFEGLPIVVMEMMARGKVILSTAVGGIPDYISHMKNGLLINEKDEQHIIATGVKYLELLASDPTLVQELGLANYNYAKEHFSEKQFVSFFRNLLIGS